MRAQQALSTHKCETQRYCVCMLIIINLFIWSVSCKKSCESVSVNITLCLILFSCDVYLLYVIYKCLSWDSDQQQDLGQAKPKTAKPSHQWEVVGRPISRGEWEDSVCFEKGARMDSFAVVLTTLSCLSIYRMKKKHLPPQLSSLCLVLEK
jgi:hypothetical protein